MSNLKSIRVKVSEYLDFRNPRNNFMIFLNYNSLNDDWININENVEILTGDKLSLIPYGCHEEIVKNLDFENNSLEKFLTQTDSKYFVTISEPCNTYLDLFCLFILESKKINYMNYNTSIFDVFFGKGSNMVFNGHYVKIDDCWFLDFDT